MSNKEFYLSSDKNWFAPEYIIVSKDIKIKIISLPYRKWYKLLLQYVTFGYYKAPFQYKCRIINN